MAKLNDPRFLTLGLDALNFVILTVSLIFLIKARRAQKRFFELTNDRFKAIEKEVFSL